MSVICWLKHFCAVAALAMRRLAKLRNMQNSPPPVRFECGQCGKEKTPHFRAEYSEWCSCTAAAARATPPPPDHDSPRGRRPTTPAAGSLDLADQSGSHTRSLGKRWPSLDEWKGPPKFQTQPSLERTDEPGRWPSPSAKERIEAAANPNRPDRWKYWSREECELFERTQRPLDVEKWNIFGPSDNNGVNVAGVPASTRLPRKKMRNQPLPAKRLPTDGLPNDGPPSSNGNDAPPVRLPPSSGPVREFEWVRAGRSTCIMLEWDNKISVSGRPFHGKFVDEGHRVSIFYGPNNEKAAVLLLETKTPRKYSGRNYPSGDWTELTFIGTRSFCQDHQVLHRG